MCLAADAQYDRARLALRAKPLADLRAPATREALTNLHPTPATPVHPLLSTDLPPSVA